MRRSSMRRLPLVVAVLLGVGCGYNTIQTMDERVNQAQGQIQTQLQRRADLIPNLVNTVKGITKQEDTVFISRGSAACSRSRRTTPSSSRARTSSSCRISWRERRTASRSPGKITTPRWESTTPTSGGSPTISPPKCSGWASRGSTSRRHPVRHRRRRCRFSGKAGKRESGKAGKRESGEAEQRGRGAGQESEQNLKEERSSGSHRMAAFDLLPCFPAVPLPRLVRYHSFGQHILQRIHRTPVHVHFIVEMRPGR
jgi:LemA family